MRENLSSDLVGNLLRKGTFDINAIEAFCDGATASWVFKQYFRGLNEFCSCTQHGWGMSWAPDLSIRSPRLYKANALNAKMFAYNNFFQQMF